MNKLLILTKRKQINLVAILVIVVSTALVIIKSVQSVSMAQSSNRQLAQLELPMLEKTQALRSLLNRQNMAFHQYYLSNDDIAFANTFSALQADITKVLQAINMYERNLPAFGSIAEESTALLQLSENMKQVMRRPTDWDGARQVLAELEPVNNRINQRINTLFGDIERVAIRQANNSLTQVEISLIWTYWLITGILIFLFVMLWFDYKRHKTQYQLRRFAGFPELNPNPVLALNEQGLVSYSNKAADKLVKQLPHLSDISQLLPQKMDDLMQRCRGKRNVITDEFQLVEQHYNVTLQWLADFKEYRLYLTDISAIKHAEHELNRIAFTDDITELGNKAALKKDFSIVTAQHQGFMLLVKLTNLSQVSLRVGDIASEKAIQSCAVAIQLLCHQRKAHVYMIRSEVFAIVTSSNDINCLTDLQNELNTIGDDLQNTNGLPFSPRWEMGVTSYGYNAQLDVILKQANIALQATSERRRFVFYNDTLATQSKRKIDMELALRNAIHGQQLSLHFQPQIAVSSGKVKGVEALLRWRDSNNNWISPAEFIPIAEESSLIIDIGQWVLENAVKKAAQMRQLYPTSLITMAINIASEQLLHADFIPLVQRTLAQHSLPPHYIELEVTESAALYDINKAISVMQILQTMGVLTALDDFGTGYSSFSYITQLPLNKLKIDQSFIKAMHQDDKLKNVTETMITMAKPLGIDVIAEGVEEAQHLTLLKLWGCDQAQGYHIAKPMPYNELVKWLNQRDKAT